MVSLRLSRGNYVEVPTRSRETVRYVKSHSSSAFDRSPPYVERQDCEPHRRSFRPAIPLPVSERHGNQYHSGSATPQQEPTGLQPVSNRFGRAEAIFRARRETPCDNLFPRRGKIFNRALPIGLND